MKYATSVGVKELKNHLSAYLRQVKKGGNVVIRERKRPVALLSPIEEDEESGAVLALVRDGVLALGRGSPKGSPAKNKIRGKALSDCILEDRG